MTLQEQVERTGPLGVRNAIGWALRLARTLRAVHARGFAHGAISPAALLVGGPACTSLGAVVHPADLLEDERFFSLARASGARPSQSDDTWALGVTLYYALTGALPYPRGVKTARLEGGWRPAPPLAVYGAALDAMQPLIDEMLPVKLTQAMRSSERVVQDLEHYSPMAIELPALLLLAPNEDWSLAGDAEGADPSGDPQVREETLTGLPVLSSTNDPPASSIPPASLRPERSLFPRTSPPPLDSEPSPDSDDPWGDDEAQTLLVEAPSPANDEPPAEAPAAPAAEAPAEPVETASAPPLETNAPPASHRLPAAYTPSVPARRSYGPLVVAAAALLVIGVAVGRLVQVDDSAQESITPVRSEAKTQASAPLIASAIATAVASAAPALAVEDVDACATHLFAPDAFDQARPSFSFLCTETNLEKGIGRIHVQLVLGSGGQATDATREWDALGRYRLAVLAAARGRCCAAPPPPLHTPPILSPCNLGPALARLGRAAVVDASEQALADAVDDYRTAAQCVAMSGGVRELGISTSVTTRETATLLRLLQRMRTP